MSINSCNGVAVNVVYAVVFGLVLSSPDHDNDNALTSFIPLRCLLAGISKSISKPPLLFA